MIAIKIKRENSPIAPNEIKLLAVNGHLFFLFNFLKNTSTKNGIIIKICFS